MRISVARPRAVAGAAALVVALTVALVLTRGEADSVPVDWSAVPAVAPRIPPPAPEPAPTAQVRDVVTTMDPCPIVRAVFRADRADRGFSGAALDPLPGRLRPDRPVQAEGRICYASDDDGGDVQVDALMGRPDVDGWRRIEVAGRAAWAIDEQPSCRTQLPLGTSATVLIRVRRVAAPCPSLVPVLDRLLRERPALARLLYRADGPDLLGVEGCRAIRRQAALACAPARTATVPDDPVQVVRRGEADADVVCSVATSAAVRDVLAASTGPRRDLLAVTVAAGDAFPGGRRQCELVSPDGLVRMGIVLDRASLDDQRARIARLSDDATIAGHRAFTDSAASGAPSLWAVALGDPADPGSLVITVVTDDVPLPTWTTAVVTALTRGLLQ